MPLYFHLWQTASGHFRFMSNNYPSEAHPLQELWWLSAPKTVVLPKLTNVLGSCTFLNTSQCQGYLFLASCCVEKSKFSSYPVHYTWDNLWEEFRPFWEAVRNAYSQMLLLLGLSKSLSKKSNIIQKDGGKHTRRTKSISHYNKLTHYRCIWDV